MCNLAFAASKSVKYLRSELDVELKGAVDPALNLRFSGDEGMVRVDGRSRGIVSSKVVQVVSDVYGDVDERCWREIFLFKVSGPTERSSTPRRLVV